MTKKTAQSSTTKTGRTTRPKTVATRTTKTKTSRTVSGRSTKTTKNETKEIYNETPSTPERKINLTSAIIVGAVTMIAGFVVGINWDNITPILRGKKAADSIDFSSLNTVYQRLAESFDGELDKSKVLDEAKRGLVNAAGDKYTYFMTASEASDFRKDLNGEIGAGIGVEIGERDGLVKVLRTTPDNPARKAGVLAGDIIYKADDEDISTLKVDDVAKKLRGEAGTKVKLTVMRDGKEISFDLTRETINNVSVYTDYKDKTAIISITRFDQNTGSLARKAAQEAIDKGCDKFIIDLRGNGGGYVSAAKDVASLWVDGKLVVEQRSSTGLMDEKTYANSGRAILAGKKTIVLTNGSSASASEILAGALKDYGLATLIGEKTFGKGSVQSLENFTNGSLLRVTVAKWYTPNGNNIDGEGIEPDQVVERTFEQINKEEDPQLDAALKY